MNINIREDDNIEIEMKGQLEEAIEDFHQDIVAFCNTTTSMEYSYSGQKL